MSEIYLNLVFRGWSSTKLHCICFQLILTASTIFIYHLYDFDCINYTASHFIANRSLEELADWNSGHKLGSLEIIMIYYWKMSVFSQITMIHYWTVFYNFWPAGDLAWPTFNIWFQFQPELWTEPSIIDRGIGQYCIICWQKNEKWGFEEATIHTVK